ncbi:unnamed protein product (macronuclear) [Paramecium tetraurelia]|uniref:MalT-like TPR region domain-containing protein n=1 Tax=Paramecium tetraurelia TaxID=5888 RepID=A0DDG7_PARTE|nr:uncharacterized protein GSPATT00015943001 [Paramecium tetraurelia]CAK81084.1 unnamed protein product [Paramecium tetraurelia]|eukprot:XP_001448481.1 hypothetical protein (macronuclear) [Paramecium tetraurelia strain d4-2]
MLNKFFGFSTQLLKISRESKIYFSFNVVGSFDYIQMIRKMKDYSDPKNNEQINNLVNEFQGQIENTNRQAEQYFSYGKLKDAQVVLQNNSKALQDLLQDSKFQEQPYIDNLNLASAKTSMLLGDCYIRQSNFDQADSSLLYSLNILQNMNSKILNVQINLLDAYVLLYQYNLYSIFDDKLLKEIEDKIDNLMKQSQQNEQLSQKYSIFKMKYLEEDQEEVDKLFKQLNQQEQSSTDLTNFLMKQAMNKGSSKSALYYCYQLLNSLVQNQDPNHHLFEASLTNYFALSRENQQQAQYQDLIQRIKTKFFNKGLDALEKIIQFEEILNQGLSALNTQQDIEQIQNLIDKLEVIKFTTGSKYHRYAVFMLLGLKRELKVIQSQII